MLLTFLLLVFEFTIGIWSMVLWGEVSVESIELMSLSFEELIKKGYDKKDWSKLQTHVGINDVYIFIYRQRGRAV